MKDILIYAGKGVSKSSFQQTFASLQLEIDPSYYTIRACTPEDILKTPWELRTALLIIPGGRDVPYHKALALTGTTRIRDFVKQGGSYLGLCAGAYFGAQEIIFEKGGELEVCGIRDLGFFPGRAIGPAYGNGKFQYDSHAGLHAAAVRWSLKSQEIFSCSTFFNGGCLFENPGNFENTRVLGVYEDLPGQPAAAVHCKMGSGCAILSGVHIEYSISNLENNPSINPLIYKKLIESETTRRRCFRSLLNLLLPDLKNDK